jgi:hypothetical protein
MAHIQFRNVTEKHQPTDSAGKSEKFSITKPNNLDGRPAADELQVVTN